MGKNKIPHESQVEILLILSSAPSFNNIPNRKVKIWKEEFFPKS
jgi:hypothetical protein